jgi:hypothetical protein
MLIATISLLDAAFVRWPISAAWWDIRVAQMCCYPLLLLVVCYDLWSTGKVHRARKAFMQLLRDLKISGVTPPKRLMRGFRSGSSDLTGGMVQPGGSSPPFSYISSAASHLDR